jgi:hypothetical protein
MKNEFWLPSIYKPFYINVLFVRNTVNKKIVENSSADTFFVIIDVYNGIGLYDKKTKLYNIGSIDITFKESDFVNDEKETNVTLGIYRGKPLFNTSYKESITTVFTGFTINYDAGYRSKELIVKYTSPDNEYGIKINRDINLKVDLEIGGNIGTNPFSLYNVQDNQYNICQTCGEIDKNLTKHVENKSNNFLYYVVNEGFYKYFINPTCNYNPSSNIYQSYNGNEVGGLTADTQRIEYDLNPNKVNYDNDDDAYLPKSGWYVDNTINYCKTTPFFRMYPSISSEPKKKESPFAVKLKKSGSAIVLEKNIYNYEVDKVKRFYLIGVKSPLTVLGDDNYRKELDEGKVIRPEQDYVTFIEYISEIETFNR